MEMSAFGQEKVKTHFQGSISFSVSEASLQTS